LFDVMVWANELFQVDCKTQNGCGQVISGCGSFGRFSLMPLGTDGCVTRAWSGTMRAIRLARDQTIV
jgi:hypothetical protein